MYNRRAAAHCTACNDILNSVVQCYYFSAEMRRTDSHMHTLNGVSGLLNVWNVGMFLAFKWIVVNSGAVQFCIVEVTSLSNLFVLKASSREVD